MQVLGSMCRLYAWMLVQVRRTGEEEDGASLVEYGLLVALIAVVVMGTLTLLGVQINTMFCNVLNELGGSC